ncbi:hypothetical protein [Caloranaerobacter azorensis]|nr:hypothetical protein [Caloranaerobacter azorensis]
MKIIISDNIQVIFETNNVALFVPNFKDNIALNILPHPEAKAVID